MVERSVLFALQEDVKLVAEAIKSVLNLEVIIYDKNKTVVASTGGGSHARVGETVRGFIVSGVLSSKKAIYNFEPGFHELCRPCSLWGDCPEKFDLSFPLMHQGEAVGVISLTAFNDVQKEELREKHEILSNYIGKMADLISSKIAAKSLLEEYLSLSQMLNVTIQSMYEGVLAVDKDGHVIELNRSGEKIFSLKREQVIGEKLEFFLPNHPINSVLLSGRGFNDEEYSCEINGKKVRVVGSATPLSNDGNIIGAVTSFKDLGTVQQYIFNMLSENDTSTFDCILGNSPALTEVKVKAKKIAYSNATVIILGESGTGKELFARSIHAESQRRNKSFRAINCAAIPEHLLESELFGYTEGAFTGAKKSGKPGKFEMANGGTIFLDEIGDMPLHLQVKILRVLEERKVERIGGNEAIEIDVRIIAATNKNLEKMVSKGEFREDLFYRLNVIPLNLPPVRERHEDIPLLLQYFVEHYANITGKQVRGFTKEAERSLMEYQWPGNVRELQNAVEYAVHMANHHWIKIEDIPERIRNFVNATEIQSDTVMSLAVMETNMIYKALEKFGSDLEGKKKAADALGINLATLYRKLNKITK
ncbi:PAS domain S-box-containing protein [Ammoniphilus resinae]|uniref:PAS domain S-box-containing protein n=1 Tax=Ammoniphilus resinae TaxID=861532 RepID=A0ABS4GM93_9BACL|nr:PAS domain S-box-containing protein [Ammoniphilus resinae]